MSAPRISFGRTGPPRPPLRTLAVFFTTAVPEVPSYLTEFPSCLRLLAKLIIVCSGLVFGFLGLRAQDFSDARSPAIRTAATVGVISNYIFRGEKLAGVSLQPSVEASLDAATIGGWSNVPWSHFVAAKGDSEVDAYGYYNLKFSRALAFLPGFTWYNYPGADAMRGNFRRALEPNLAANVFVQGVRVTPEIFYDFARRARTLELAAAYAYALPSAGTELDFNALIGTTELHRAVDGARPDTERGRDYAAAGVSVPYQLAHWRAAMGFQYEFGFAGYVRASGAVKQSDPAVAGRGVFSLSIGYQW